MGVIEFEEGREKLRHRTYDLSLMQEVLYFVKRNILYSILFHYPIYTIFSGTTPPGRGIRGAMWGVPP